MTQTDTGVGFHLTSEVIILPFLKPKKNVAASVVEHVGNENSDLINIALDLLHAIDARDEKAIASAFKAAFKCCEMEPHDEVSHEENYE